MDFSTDITFMSEESSIEKKCKMIYESMLCKYFRLPGLNFLFVLI